MAPRQMTPRERPEQKKRHLEAELSNVNVIDHLNPSF